VGWFAPKDLMQRQLTNNGALRSRIIPIVMFMLKWLAPIAILAIFISGIL
jgi:hypothetical protein